MGAYRYVQELYRKKQSEVMRYLLRIRVWQYRQLTKLHRCPRPSRPDKARRLGFRAKQGIRHLPHSYPPWWSQAPRPQGMHLRQAQEPRYQRAEAIPQAAKHCRGELVSEGVIYGYLYSS